MWRLYTDGASNSDSSGAGLTLVSPEGKKYTYALRFEFEITNNEAEYEALLTGLRIATYMKIDNLIIDGNLYPKSYLSPWLRCVGPVQAKGIIQEISFSGFEDHEATILIAFDAHRRKSMNLEVRSMYTEHQKSSNGETLFSLTYGLEAVVPIEISVKTEMIKEFEVRKNDKRRQEDLDILEERREIASIREAHYKQKLKRYYNKRVRPSTFKPGTYMLQLNSASKAELQGKIGPT
ncbi:reverse transcriptase domain-containing protein [Tanacetum coccineum]